MRTVRPSHVALFFLIPTWTPLSPRQKSRIYLLSASELLVLPTHPTKHAMLHYWTFPFEGNSALFPSNAQQSDLTIRQYLNISAAHPPTGGFGLVAPYAGDVLKLSWPSDDYISLSRSWHCMPCRPQTIHNRTHEEFDWGSCSYHESPPKIYTMTIPLNPKIKSKPSLRSSPITLSWPYLIESQTLLCALAIPGAFPDGLSAAFPFVNAPRPSGRDPHTFSLDAPLGAPLQFDPDFGGLDGPAWSMVLVVVLFVLLVVMIVAGRRVFLGRVAACMGKCGWGRKWWVEQLERERKGAGSSVDEV